MGIGELPRSISLYMIFLLNAREFFELFAKEQKCQPKDHVISLLGFRQEDNEPDEQKLLKMNSPEKRYGREKQGCDIFFYEILRLRDAFFSFCRGVKIVLKTKLRAHRATKTKIK